MKKLRLSPGLVIVAVLWLALTLWCWLKPPGDISQSERRKLAQFPEVSARSVLSGRFADSFEDYALDQFPARDGFRMVKSLASKYLLWQSDNNGIYIWDGYAAKHEYVLNENSVRGAGEKLRAIYEEYVKESGGDVYLTVIPDKGHYLAEDSGHMTIDFDKLVDIICSELDFAEYIGIEGCLSADDYYRTDSHWRQENIADIASAIAEAMGAELSGEYETRDTGKEFLGVYAGQAALPMRGDRIMYLTNSVIAGCTVYNPETGKTGGVYNTEGLSGRDPYDFFMYGATPVLYIENPAAEGEKRLVVFRDSFGSSLIPLMAEGYSHITVADTRYISPELLGDYVDFDGADVLFMYSSSLLNDSGALR